MRRNKAVHYLACANGVPQGFQHSVLQLGALRARRSNPANFLGDAYPGLPGGGSLDIEVFGSSMFRVLLYCMSQ